MQQTEDAADDLPRVLLENYLMLAAAVDCQNSGRLSDMLQYSQKVHQNLLEVIQQVEEAPTLAMTAGRAAAQPEAAAARDSTDEVEGGRDVSSVLGTRQPGLAVTSQTQQAASPLLQQQQQQQMCDMQVTCDPADLQARTAAQEQHLQQQHLHSTCQQQLPQLPLPRRHQQQQCEQSSPQPSLPSQQQHYNYARQQQGKRRDSQPLPPSSSQEAQQQSSLQSSLLPQQQPSAVAGGPWWLQHVEVSVAELLNSIGLSQFVPLLEQQQVDMAALSLMEERHLRELGLPMGAVVKIKAALAAKG